MADISVPSLDLVRRTLAIELAYTLSRLKVLEAIPGNPVGIAYRLLGDGAAALMARYLPVPSFNTVVGLRAGDERHIEPLVAWYRAHEVKLRFEMVPGLYDPALGRELTRLGCFQSDFHVSMIASPVAGEPDLAPGLSIERVSDAATMEDFLDAYAAGWSIPPQSRAQFKANVRPWRDQAGWSLFLGRADGRPAAAAILYVDGATAYCADASTDPSHRGRGLQTALLHHRIAEAHAAGADLICSGATYLSTSHRNMARAGLRLQFVRAIWTTV